MRSDNRCFMQNDTMAMALDDDFLLDDGDDEKTIAFIRNFLPQELKNRFSDDELYYFLDTISDYYVSSGCLDAEPDEEGYIDIDRDKIVDYVVREAEKDGIGTFTAEEILWVVQGEMEYANSVGGME